MGLTVSVKEELSRVDIRSSSARKAEVSTFLRFAGGLQSLPGRLVVQAEVDLISTAKRLQGAIADLYGHRTEVFRPSVGRVHSAGRYIVQAGHGSNILARQAGLLDRRGHPVRGLPPAVVNGSVADVEAVWRAAFLAQGSLTEKSRSTVLEVMCPGPEAALALVGAARRLGIEAAAREVRGVDRVVIRDYDAIAALLTRMGADTALTTWREQRRANEVKVAAANRVVNVDDSNLRRSLQAAQINGARVQRALEILGDDISEQLKLAAELRVTHQRASLEELGRLADPPLSKDTIAGRIRRLLDIADKRASELGIPQQTN